MKRVLVWCQLDPKKQGCDMLGPQGGDSLSGPTVEVVREEL